MSKLRKSLPTDRRQKCAIGFGRSVLEEGAKELEMVNDFRDFGRTKIVVRHEFEVRLDLIRVIGRQRRGYRRLQRIPFDLGLFVVRFLIGEVPRSGVKKL